MYCFRFQILDGFNIVEALLSEGHIYSGITTYWALF